MKGIRMFNCETEFLKFYSKHVVLSQKEQNELREKKQINIDRLKKGLKKLNLDNNTNYRIAETRTQGSMSMHTVVQNDAKEYDIDIAIVFDNENIDGIGPLSTRNIVAKALSKETHMFSEPPEVKTSCVRLKYSNGYHIDFAIFKRNKDLFSDNYTYEHAGALWTQRDVKLLEKWFTENLTEKGDNFRKIIRLLKMFCKSRDYWGNMPSGLVITLLVNECFDFYHENIDEQFYYTLMNIKNRLKLNLEVFAPFDNNRKITTRQSDLDCNARLYNKLDKYLKQLNILFESSCDKSCALEVWKEFFNHDYWNEASMQDRLGNRRYSFDNTEEFIEDKYTILEKYYLKLDCIVSESGSRDRKLKDYLEKNFYSKFNIIPKKRKLKCSIQSTDCPSYDKVLWKVRNIGEEAEKRNCIRGQILQRGIKIEEPTVFKGNHYIECYLIKNNICVAIGHLEVPIGDI